MKKFLVEKLWPVIAGFIAASAVMMVFEFTNSFFFPFPEGMNVMDIEAVHAFTESLPWTAYILVLLGWIGGSFSAGWVTTRFSGERRYRLAFIVGALLTIGGIANNILIGHTILFNIIGLPVFIVFTYVGNRVARQKYKR